MPEMNGQGGHLASYNPNAANVADDNVHGNIQVDDYGSITAAAGTDGIRGENYGTGSVTITAEAGALISGGRYGISALSHDGGNVSVANYATTVGTTAAVNAATTSTGTAVIDISLVISTLTTPRLPTNVWRIGPSTERAHSPA